jgi:DNA polymerase-3 subunit delta'
LGFDLDAYTAARADAIVFLRYAAAATGAAAGARGAAAELDHSALFKMTESYRAGADGQTKTLALLRALALLLEDLLLVDSGTPELLRNTDLRAELEALAETLSFAWIERASQALDQVHSGLRRNLLRNLSLDAFAAQLANPVNA